jgi:hypothetical protein
MYFHYLFHYLFLLFLLVIETPCLIGLIVNPIRSLLNSTNRRLPSFLHQKIIFVPRQILDELSDIEGIIKNKNDTDGTIVTCKLPKPPTIPPHMLMFALLE